MVDLRPRTRAGRVEMQRQRQQQHQQQQTNRIQKANRRLGEEEAKEEGKEDGGYDPRGGHGQNRRESGGKFDGWSAHVRYFLARYPLETRQFVAQRLATYGIRSLLSSHRQEDLTIDVLASATDTADKDVLSLMRQHAKGRRQMAGGSLAPGYRRPSPSLSPHENRKALLAINSNNNGGGRVAPPRGREILRERALMENADPVRRMLASTTAAAATTTARAIDYGGSGGSGGGDGEKRLQTHTVTARPDVLTRYPFVDDLSETRGGGVGAALHRATPTTPLQNLAKREIRRLAHETFRELKASALGIRLSDLPSAIQFLFFGDSASLLMTKGNNNNSGGWQQQQQAAGRTAKDVHLVVALARESLPSTLALAARDTSTLSSAASTNGGGAAADVEWAQNSQNMFISERRWIRVVAHVVRRLWAMDGKSPTAHNTAEYKTANIAANAWLQRQQQQQQLGATGTGTSKKKYPHPAVIAGTATAAAAAAPYAEMATLQQPVWRPTGGAGRLGRGRRHNSPINSSADDELLSGVVGGGGRGGDRAHRWSFLGEEGYPKDEEEQEKGPSSLLGGDLTDSRRLSIDATTSAGTGWWLGSETATSRHGNSGGSGGHGGNGEFLGRDDDELALRAWERGGEEEEAWAVGEGGGVERSSDWLRPGVGAAAGEGVYGGDGSGGSGGGSGSRYFGGVENDSGGGGSDGAVRGARRREGGGASGQQQLGGSSNGPQQPSMRRVSGEKEGTRPAGMWEVTPPAHVAAMREQRGGGGRGGVMMGKGGKGKGEGSRPAYLRGVQSKIGPQVDAHKERLRKIASARNSAVRNVVARRRLEHHDGRDGLEGVGSCGGNGGGGGEGLTASSGGLVGSQDSSRLRGNSPGEHALEIADAFLGSTLMTRLAGGDWFGGNCSDGPISADLSSSALWKYEGAVRVPRPRGRDAPPKTQTYHSLVGAQQQRQQQQQQPYSMKSHAHITRSVGRGSESASGTRRQAYTGWLGDFGPAHTHAVKEALDGGIDDDDDDDSGGGGSGGREGDERGGNVAQESNEEGVLGREKKDEGGTKEEWEEEREWANKNSTLRRNKQREEEKEERWVAPVDGEGPGGEDSSRSVMSTPSRSSIDDRGAGGSGMGSGGGSHATCSEAGIVEASMDSSAGGISDEAVGGWGGDENASSRGGMTADSSASPRAASDVMATSSGSHHHPNPDPDLNPIQQQKPPASAPSRVGSSSSSSSAELSPLSAVGVTVQGGDDRRGGGAREASDGEDSGGGDGVAGEFARVITESWWEEDSRSVVG